MTAMTTNLCGTTMSIEQSTRIAELEAEVAALHNHNASVSMLAHKWMEAHDKLMARQPYELPSTVDLPDAIRRAEKAEAALAEARRVIEPFAKVASAFSFAIAPDSIDDGMAVVAHAHVKPDSEVVLSTTNFSAARDWLSRNPEIIESERSKVQP